MAQQADQILAGHTTQRCPEGVAQQNPRHTASFEKERSMGATIRLDSHLSNDDRSAPSDSSV